MVVKQEKLERSKEMTLETSQKIAKKKNDKFKEKEEKRT